MKEKILELIKLWENRCYSNGIPDEAPYELESRNKVISYRLICRAILKNDYSLKTLGINNNKTKIYHELKRIELTNKGKIKQLRLNL